MQDLAQLQKRITQALTKAITQAVEDPQNPAAEVFNVCNGQIQYDVVGWAAAAAAIVFITFYRGYLKADFRWVEEHADSAQTKTPEAKK